ncbi:hypothetical protein J4Q44_G00376290 [Coregonus suidteri]|uniref:C-type lectin domain-containing protein n=1 Tax=Coregonus suidteri TaxID=861788 RepID=A0AAN8Q4X4_9TELE
MKRCVPLLLLLSGFHQLSSSLTGQYFFVNDPKTWTEAQSYCREKYTDLATIDNMEDMNRFRQVVNGYNGNVWIGLYDDVNSWRWSLEDSGFYGDGEAVFRNWDSGQPDNQGSGQYCTVMRDNGRWNDERCSNKDIFICYDGGTNSSNHFSLINESRSWSEAQSYCRDHHTDLASVRNQTENQEIQRVANGSNVWIGLFRDSWKWSDQSNSSFRYWIEGEPNNFQGRSEGCVEASMTNNGQWNDEICILPQYFVCYYTGYAGVQVKFTSTTALTDSNITELVLKKLQDELRQRGISDSVTLRWKKKD